MKLRPVRIDEKPAMKMPRPTSRTEVFDVVRRERRVERPAGVDAAVEERPQREGPADRVEVPREQVDAREREVLRPDHERDQEVPEDRRDARDEEEEDHQHAVHREQAVVDVGLEEVALGRRELHADEDRHEAAEREEDAHGDEVEKGDALVVARPEPRLEAVGRVQVVRARELGGDRIRRRRHFRASAAPSGRLERLHVVHELDQLLLGDLALEGRHHGLVALHDLRARVQDRLADVVLVRRRPSCRPGA